MSTQRLEYPNRLDPPRVRLTVRVRLRVRVRVRLRVRVRVRLRARFSGVWLGLGFGFGSAWPGASAFKASGGRGTFSIQSDLSGSSSL